MICETCRAELIADASFCEQCGARVPSSNGDLRSANRVERNVGIAAAVSDRGNLHHKNDDAFSLERFDTGIAAVVCDGVSTSFAADVAARRAADTAGRMLAEAFADESPGLDETVAAALASAQGAVEQLPPAPGSSALAAPACTLVCAVCRGSEIVLGWLGDSRAYWIGADSSTQLTVDNSWAREQVAAGAMTAQQAAADPRARSITRWLGGDAPDEPPQLVTLEADEPGSLVLCTDGLWDYSPEADDLGRLVRQLPEASSPLAIARLLVDGALARGGHDNITAAVIDVRPEGS